MVVHLSHQQALRRPARDPRRVVDAHGARRLLRELAQRPVEVHGMTAPAACPVRDPVRAAPVHHGDGAVRDHQDSPVAPPSPWRLTSRWLTDSSRATSGSRTSNLAAPGLTDKARQPTVLPLLHSVDKAMTSVLLKQSGVPTPETWGRGACLCEPRHRVGVAR
jgi:hypothetical protein